MYAIVNDGRGDFYTSVVFGYYGDGDDAWGQYYIYCPRPIQNSTL